MRLYDKCINSSLAFLIHNTLRLFYHVLAANTSYYLCFLAKLECCVTVNCQLTIWYFQLLGCELVIMKMSSKSLTSLVPIKD